MTWQWQGGDFFFFKVLVTIFCLFIFDCAGSSVLLGLLSRCSEWGLLSGCDVQTCCRARALGHAGFSRCGSQALDHRYSSCGAWLQLLRGMWNPPGPGIKPGSPVLADVFSTAEPPGKP